MGRVVKINITLPEEEFKEFNAFFRPSFPKATQIIQLFY
jgi:hypothetical protein